MIGARLVFALCFADVIGTAEAFVGWTNMTIDDRFSQVYVPACLHSASPIILSLHAMLFDETDEIKMDRFHIGADKECTLVLYPRGKAPATPGPGMKHGYTWNAGGCCPSAMGGKGSLVTLQHVDDMSFLEKLLDVATDKYQLRDPRVFVAGLSNGAMMANRMACSSKRVTAVVGSAGPLMQGVPGTGQDVIPCNKGVPTLYFHGVEDIMVPYDGCKNVTGSKAFICWYWGKFVNMSAPSIPVFVDGLRTRLGIGKLSVGVQSFTNGSASCTSWGSATQNVTFCTIQKMGHAWPGYCQAFSHLPGYGCTYDIDATEQSWAFMKNYFPTPIGQVVNV